ncbi:MAG: ATP-binding cassette domain-containing protein [Chloroflexota bacterium]|nr:ATP-binding cassette domain-containing protein [Chloroflexota bacterium]
MTILLDVHGYTKHFTVHHLGRNIPTFSEVSFTLREGEFLLVRGQNGAGKSTLLRCLYRTYLPTSGAALYHSHLGSVDLARAADVDIALLRRHEIGFVTQFLRPRPRVSALEWVAEPLLTDGMAYNQAREFAEAMLSDFGIKRDLWGAYPSTFSGGEQQRVNVARALILPRRLLLLDEPTASLDASARAALTRRLTALKAQGVTLIGIFHYPDEIRSLVDSEIDLQSEALPDVAD